jgi:hypothetical protein
MYGIISVDFSNVKGVEREVLRVLRDEFQRIFNTATPRINEKFRDLLLREIRNCKEFQSLKDNSKGSLKGEFGVVDPEERINALLDLWAKQFYFSQQRVVVSGNDLKGGFQLEAIKVDYVEAGKIGQFESENGFMVEWLKWLALAGDRYVINNYYVRFGNIPRSRTGLALMIKVPKRKYRVNPAFSGDENKNFITRSFDKITAMIPTIIGDEIRDAI